MKAEALLPVTVALTMALAACSAPGETNGTAPDSAATQSAAATTDDSAMADAPGTLAAGAVTPNSGRAGSGPMTLEGLGDLVIGRPVPAGSSFSERGAQIDGNCRMVSSPDYPGVYAITERDQVRRITVGEPSNVKLVEGIGIGATAADVLREFPGFRSSPHRYISAPGRYFTQPGNDPRLRFEIGENGRVSLFHVGLMPQLGYVEGCA